MRRSEEHGTRDGESTSRQLFTVVRDVHLIEYPSFDNDSGIYDTSTTRRADALVFMRWPNGQPCLEIELYLLSLAENGARLDRNGGSVRQEAVKLSPLVRFCYKNGLNFWDIWSDHFQRFIDELKDEIKPDGRKARELNQVLEISDSCIRFLTWLQESLLPHRTIVDVKGKPHQILLKLKKTKDQRTGRTYTSYHFFGNPPSSTRQLKTPMPKESIDKLFDAITKKYDIENCHPRLRRRFQNEDALRKYLEFQRATWDGVLTVCLAFGCRPAEVSTMSRTKNLEKMGSDKKLVLATMKQKKGAEREVPVTMNIVIKLAVYERKYRSEMLDQLRTAGKNPNPSDFLFLNTLGNPLTKETLTRQFERLCRYADINERACLSMFRHRAITSLVAIHLKEFCSPRLDIAMQALNDADYSTILAKVASITGHLNPESLRDYIHLAWDELGAFDPVDAATKLSAMLLTLVNDLTFRVKKVERAPAKEQAAALQDSFHLIRESEKEMRELLDLSQRVKANPGALFEHTAAR
ncbi:tyrosine-type recombinase/integrase [Burkholderia sp. Ax-1719]|uniref:tyrosine-type recombinase/integrase n=1 Tax=Burkholderia sp. Ax-1719 TaxID=2608334 RepID=UPI0014218ECF|nr:tyrosine-type recombinase/integrase [Burkholderia sp. Ax-1719]NIE66842.1 tyrosine-type recombinase/integrase [Burkholderia sp. Ax-1719]